MRLRPNWIRHVLLNTCKESRNHSFQRQSVQVSLNMFFSGCSQCSQCSQCQPRKLRPQFPMTPEEGSRHHSHHRDSQGVSTPSQNVLWTTRGVWRSQPSGVPCWRIEGEGLTGWQADKMRVPQSLPFGRYKEKKKNRKRKNELSHPFVWNLGSLFRNLTYGSPPACGTHKLYPAAVCQVSFILRINLL